MLVFMITSLETIGDITATSDVSEQPVSGPLYMKRLKGGVLANGLNSFVSAVFNTFPNSCFGQNNGVIQLTGVASRYVGFVVALMLVVLGLFPAVSGFVQHIPEPVYGRRDAGHVRYHRGLRRAYRLPRAAEPPRNHDYCAVSRRRTWRLPAADDFAVCPGLGEKPALFRHRRGRYYRYRAESHFPA